MAHVNTAWWKNIEFGVDARSSSFTSSLISNSFRACFVMKSKNDIDNDILCDMICTQCMYNIICMNVSNMERDIK